VLQHVLYTHIEYEYICVHVVYTYYNMCMLYTHIKYEHMYISTCVYSNVNMCIKHVLYTHIEYEDMYTHAVHTH